MKRNLMHAPIRILCSLLIMAAPLLVTAKASILLWGEPDYPEV